MLKTLLVLRVSHSQPDLGKDGAGANATSDDLDPNMRSLQVGEGCLANPHSIRNPALRKEDV